MANYHRVLPRDLFNEAKLLKCLGQLALKIHDGVPWPLTIEHETQYGGQGFRIGQDQSSGDLFCQNVTVRIAGQLLFLRSSYNSKHPYPLHLSHTEQGEIVVFDDNGEFASEFVQFMESQQALVDCPVL